MALASNDERDLLLPIFSGIREPQLWQTFQKRLLARTGAQRVTILIRAPDIEGTVLFQSVASSGDVEGPELNLDELNKREVLILHSLRPHRVYSLEELIVIDHGTHAEDQQRAALEHHNIAFARVIRIPGQDDNNIWIMLVHDRHDFGAADSALLSALAPHLALAFSMLLDSSHWKLRATLAEEALSFIGVGQAALDRDGKAIIADNIATHELDIQPGGRPQLRANEAHDLNDACRAIASASLKSRQVVRFDERRQRDMLMRPHREGDSHLKTGAVGTCLLRVERQGDPVSTAKVIAATHGLSDREAALAEAMCRGRSIIEAGTELQLTPETSRNYSKRIYAKTGVSGQADLVRLLLTGLAPFA